MPHPTVVLERLDEGIALITLRRPESLNAVNARLSTELGEALEQLEHDDDLRVGILTGSGRAFCAGADLKAAAAGEDIGAVGHPEWGFGGIVDHPISKPLIAAVNGTALGGGTEIMLCCDLAVASEQATFGLPEVKRGVIAGARGLVRLGQQLPVKLAMEYALTGATMTAQTAVELGLINRVVPAEELLETSLGLARTIAENAPLSVRASKALVTAASDNVLAADDPLRTLEQDAVAAVIASADAREGIAAFAEKRAPRWRGV